MLTGKNRFTYSGLTAKNKRQKTVIDTKTGLDNRISDRKFNSYQESKPLNWNSYFNT